MLTDEELAAIRERAEKATPGPWRYHPGIIGAMEARAHREGYVFCLGDEQGDIDDADGEFIATAREDIPALLEEIDRLKGLIDPRHMQVICPHLAIHPKESEPGAWTCDDCGWVGPLVVVQ